ncbi:MAG: CAP domain-containing protein [Myxococcales bacterium]|nr:CAP domain-containing protein [Myxococcales bacterium]
MHAGASVRTALVVAALGALSSPACTDGDDDVVVAPLPDLPYCTPFAEWDPAFVALEVEVLVLMNQRRGAPADCGGLAYAPAPALTMHPALHCAARAHSRDMADRAFFDHTNPDGATPFDRMASAGYPLVTGGENIAMGYPDAPSVMEGWMTSPGHCANIMSQDFTEAGVGYFLGAYFTTTFGRR